MSGTRELRVTVDPNSLWFLRRVSSSLWLLKPVSSCLKNKSFLPHVNWTFSSPFYILLPGEYSQNVDFYLLILLMVLNFPFSIDKVYIPPSEIEGTSSSDTAHLWLSTHFTTSIYRPPPPTHTHFFWLAKPPQCPLINGLFCCTILLIVDSYLPFLSTQASRSNSSLFYKAFCTYLYGDACLMISLHILYVSPILFISKRCLKLKTCLFCPFI